MQRAYYQATIHDFRDAADSQVLGELAGHHGHALEERQRNAWVEQIRHLKDVLEGSGDGDLFFEFSIPRMGRRADVVLLLQGVVIVLEYKVGAQGYHAQDVDQAVDYALDLKNFHAGSHDLPIAPVLVATEAPDRSGPINWSDDAIAEPILANRSNLRSTLNRLTQQNRKSIPTQSWLNSSYKPTPTIVEAAKALYSNHTVEEISRSDSGAINLSKTATAVANVIESAKVQKRKVICFITGVPGSGKTLAGLNLATERMQVDQSEHAVFLSGNGPLVKVLREALARDLVERAKNTGQRLTKTDARPRVETFIQNIHHFRDEALRSSEPPVERVVVFDEAQRAWTREETSRFMHEKRGKTSFDMSEPEFLLSVMDRHDEWCAVICLVGSGQEINKGEAGIAEWLRALSGPYKHWHAACPDKHSLTNDELGGDLDDLVGAIAPQADPSLHLGVSIRSFRSESVSDFVSAVIDGDAGRAHRVHSSLEQYPIVMTRELDCARNWLRERARGSERYGLVSSSNALRLRPVGIHVKSPVDVAAWFLNPKGDVRSSYALEQTGSEFEVQGLELDWVGICWDANFRYTAAGWGLYRFSGSTWSTVRDSYRRTYLANAYRVLLTRARQGMVVFVPYGSDDDPTRSSSYYDGTFQFLKKCGINELQ